MGEGVVKKSSFVMNVPFKGASFNYVDKILSIIDQLLTSFLTIVKEFLYCYVRENLLTADISSTTYLLSGAK